METFKKVKVNSDFFDYINKFTLPSWSEIKLSVLFSKGDIFDGPFGSNLKTDDYTQSGVRVIRLENIATLEFINSKESYISEDKYETLKKHTVSEGDLIFSSFISEPPRACLLPKLDTLAIAKADCFCLRPNSNLINKKYLCMFFVSQLCFEQLKKSMALLLAVWESV